jgi:hypothetical protein
MNPKRKEESNIKKSIQDLKSSNYVDSKKQPVTTIKFVNPKELLMTNEAFVSKIVDKRSHVGEPK